MIEQGNLDIPGLVNTDVLPWHQLLFVFLLCLFLGACGSEGNNADTDLLETGSLSLGLTDASTDEYQAVYVTINEIQVNMGGEGIETSDWKTVSTPMETYNLLALVNGIVEDLGSFPLEEGGYEQMRLIFGTSPSNALNILGVVHPHANYVINTNNNSYKLKIPSDINTGIILDHDFDIDADYTTELILDFDASASVVQAAVSPNWLLKPTIRVLDTQEYAIIHGIISFSDSSEGIEGVRVSLQYETPDAEDPKDAVTIQAATVSDEEDEGRNIERGEFTLLAQPGSYRLVSCKENYIVGCTVIDTVAGEAAIQDVELTSGALGTIQGVVQISGGGSEQYATLSFRQPTACEGTGESCTIELQSVNSVTGFWYDADLPVGTYSLVASSEGMNTEVYDDIEVTDGGVTTLHVYLEQ